MTKQERLQAIMNQLKALKGTPANKLDDGFYDMVGCLEGITCSQEELSADPKLAYLVEKHGL